jgi:hypothetical protein
MSSSDNGGRMGGGAESGGSSRADSGPGKQSLTSAASSDAGGPGKTPLILPMPMKVTARALHVRSAPSQDKHNIVGGLHHGQVVDAKDRTDPWLKIAFHGKEAFIHGDFAAPVAAAGHTDHNADHAPAAHASPSAHTEVPDHPPEATHAVPPAPQVAAPTPTHASTPPAPAPAAPTTAPAPAAPTTTAATPAVAPVPAHVQGPAAQAPAVVAPSSAPAVAARNANEMFEHIYTAGSGKNTQQVAVFVSPGITATPNVFVFLHGHDAQLKIDNDAEHKGKSGNLSGIDVAAETARVAKNTIAILPQGVIGGSGDRGKHEGGYMKALEGGLPGFLNSLLPQVAKDIGQPALAPAHIGLAGHSAGGYVGINEALGDTHGLEDTITDITLMDTDYSPSHFEATAKWLLKKPAAGQVPATKTLRISESDFQMKQAAAKGFKGAIKTFGEDVFRPRAEKAGFTFTHLDAGQQHGGHNVALAHYQLQLDGKLHADILLLQSDRGGAGHHQVRDDILDDSILSVGQGAAATDTFGGATVAGKGVKSLDGLHGDAPAPAKSAAPAVKAVTEADLHAAVAKVPAGGDAAAGATHATAAAHDAPTDEAHGMAGPKVAAALVEANKTKPAPTAAAKPTGDHAAWVHDTNDATSAMTPKTKALYDKAMETLRAGNLIFPAEKEVEPKTSKPFRDFVKALYGQFGVVEKRINNDISKHGGSAYGMKAYVEDTLSPLPSNTIASGHGPQRMNTEMLAAFLKMREAAAKDNVVLLAVSCYREPKANAKSSNHFAVATNSSHGYGLAIDLQLSVDAAHTADGKKFGVSETNTHDATNLMKYYQSSVMKWMAINGQQFDFHPYFNEPWHFEYNPEGMATKMVEGAKAWKAAHATNA